VLLLACSGDITAPGTAGGNGGGGGGGGGAGSGSGGGGGSGGAAAPTDEQFPANLLQPYSGPAIDVYDNTFLGC